MLNALAKFGAFHPATEADIERLERLAAAGLVANDPGSQTYWLTVRGWALICASTESE
jgi:hypothetical protein